MQILILPCLCDRLSSGTWHLFVTVTLLWSVYAYVVWGVSDGVFTGVCEGVVCICCWAWACKSACHACVWTAYVWVWFVRACAGMLATRCTYATHMVCYARVCMRVECFLV